MANKNQSVEMFETTEGELLSHYRIAKNKYGETIKVPVVDVRDGLSYRIMAYQMSKGRASKYIPYNEYHRSHKKQ
jgi:hypothetical protein